MDNRYLSIVLAGVTAIAALCSLGLFLLDPQSINVSPDTGSAAKLPDVAAVLAAKPPPAPVFDRYDEVLERPLFNEDRRRSDPALAEGASGGDAGPAASAALDVTLSGVIITPQARFATLTRKGAGKKKAPLVQTVQLGERLAPPLQGWRVAAIQARELSLEKVRGGAKTALKLEVYTGSLGQSKAQAKPRSTRAAKKPAARTTTKNKTAEARKNEIKRRIAEERARRRQQQEKRKNQ